MSFLRFFKVYIPMWLRLYWGKFVLFGSASLIAVIISYPNKFSEIGIKVIDFLSGTAKACLSSPNDGMKALSMVCILLFTAGVFFLLLFLYTSGAKQAAKRIYKASKKQQDIFLRANRSIEQQVEKYGGNEFSVKKILRQILQDILILDEFSTERDEAYLFDEWGAVIEGSKKPGKCVKDFGKEHLNALKEEVSFAEEELLGITIRIEKEADPVPFEYFRQFKTMEFIPFEVLGTCYYLIILSPRKNAMAEVNYTYLMETVKNVILIRDLFFGPNALWKNVKEKDGS